MEKSVPKNREGANKTTGMEVVLGLSVPPGRLSCWLQDHEQVTLYGERQYCGQCYSHGSFAQLSHRIIIRRKQGNIWKEHSWVISQ